MSENSTIYSHHIINLLDFFFFFSHLKNYTLKDRILRIMNAPSDTPLGSHKKSLAASLRKIIKVCVVMNISPSIYFREGEFSFSFFFDFFLVQFNFCKIFVLFSWLISLINQYYFYLFLQNTFYSTLVLLIVWGEGS